MSIADDYPCPRCGSANIRLGHVGSRKIISCSDCGHYIRSTRSWKQSEREWKDACLEARQAEKGPICQ